jgi:predicted phosphodiesterase
MKLNILSDIHNEFSVLPHPETDADVVILAGDIDIKIRAIPWALQFNKPVIYVLGNHEFYKNQLESVKAKTREQTIDTNIHFLDDDEVVIDGVRFLGGTLWTDFNLFGRANSEFAMLDAQFGMTDFHVIKIGPAYRKFRPRDTVTLHEKTVAFLTEKLNKPFDGKTVIVTHHAPSLRSVHHRYLNDKLTPGYASNLEYLMSEKVSLWVHGHVHHCNDYEINGTRVVSNPRGYQFQGQTAPENEGFNPSLIVEI